MFADACSNGCVAATAPGSTVVFGELTAAMLLAGVVARVNCAGGLAAVVICGGDGSSMAEEPAAPVRTPALGRTVAIGAVCVTAEVVVARVDCAGGLATVEIAGGSGGSMAEELATPGRTSALTRTLAAGAVCEAPVTLHDKQGREK